MEDVLREKFSSVRNADLERELGISNRTLLRHARRLGLEKSAAFLAEVSRRGLDTIEWMRLCGKRVGGYEKGTHPGTAGSFRKGHKWDAGVEAKRVKAIRDRAWDERVREIRGMVPKTKWPKRLARDLKGGGINL